MSDRFAEDGALRSHMAAMRKAVGKANHVYFIVDTPHGVSGYEHMAVKTTKTMAFEAIRHRGVDLAVHKQILFGKKDFQWIAVALYFNMDGDDSVNDRDFLGDMESAYMIVPDLL